MRARRERDPRYAARQRATALEFAAISAHMESCCGMAVLLARDNDRRMHEVTESGAGRAAIEAEWLECKRRVPLIQFFASRALAHFACSHRACKRARRCADAGLRCMRGRVLDREEEFDARRDYAEFIRVMKAPENESEQMLGGRGEGSDSIGRRSGRGRL
jgi:hypothetical protein